MKKFQNILLAYYRDHKRDLPWRREDITAYEVWISEIMLQQTQVSRVIPYFERFLQRFPDVHALASAEWETFLPYYAGLGYYRRGRNMLATARIIVEEFGGKFPHNFIALTSLPGIGRYTARAILAFAFHQPVLAFDTNMQRVFGRYLHGGKDAVLDTEQIEKDFSKNDHKQLHVLSAAVMDFANSICLSQPQCAACPLAATCSYALSEGANEKIRTPRNKRFPTRDARVHLWLHRDHKEYYSPNPDRFEIFELPMKINTRDAIKKYFREQFGLELAVRPPHRKIYTDTTPVMHINAQILLGSHQFGIFSREEVLSGGHLQR